MDDTYMRRAIGIGRSSLGRPRTLPYGALVVLDGRVVGEDLNRSLELYDPITPPTAMRANSAPAPDFGHAVVRNALIDALERSHTEGRVIKLG